MFELNVKTARSTTDIKLENVRLMLKAELLDNWRCEAEYSPVGEEIRRQQPRRYWLPRDVLTPPR